MEWQRLVSNKRVPSLSYDYENTACISAFDSDYRRVVKSDAFRRLQDKTQVFPLERNDFVRTRLTHSLEVAMVSRDILTEVIKALKKSGENVDLLNDSYRLMETAALIHDIGNPPFGHFGEEAIRIWFKKNGSKLECWDSLSTQQQFDFLNFEGNAQTIRLLTKIYDYNGSSANGMRLTASVLDSVIKYTATSAEVNKDYLLRKKIGYFFSEETEFFAIKEATGTGTVRHPLVFLLEAADDISYTFSDVEDAYGYGLYTFDQIKNFLEKETKLSTDKIFKDIYSSSDNVIFQRFIRETQQKVYKSASQVFVSNYNKIMNGNFTSDLMIEASDEIKLFNALKKFAHRHIFNTKEILDQEVLGFNIMSRLLDEFVPVTLKYEKTGQFMNKYEERLFNNISESAKTLYKKEVEGYTDESIREYYRLKMAVDFVCNMTDGYAKKLHDTLF